MNIRAMYFSGTGTTAKVTAAIADELAKALAAGKTPGEEALEKNAGSENDWTKALERAARDENTLAGSLEGNAGAENNATEVSEDNARVAKSGSELLKANAANQTAQAEAQERAAGNEKILTENLRKASEDGSCRTEITTPDKPLAADPETWQRADDIDFTPPAARQENHQFTPDDLIVFGVPVIAGRVPNVLLKFLDTLQGGNALAVPVVLYGNRNFDDALIELRNILQDHGFHAIAAAAFIGEHSFSRILAAGRPDSSDMELSRDFARKLAGKIRRRGAAALRKTAPVPVDGADPVRPYYKPQDRNGNPINILKVKPKLHAELCSGCGICTAVCPMGSIMQENPGQAPAPITGICIKCCGCVKKCPNEAFYFDDPGFLYHKEELEEMYAGTRREPSLYL